MKETPSQGEKITTLSCGHMVCDSLIESLYEVEERGLLRKTFCFMALSNFFDSINKMEKKVDRVHTGKIENSAGHLFCRT